MVRVGDYTDPYPECKDCKDMTICKHIEVATDMFGSNLPPDVCPKPMDVMREYTKLKKRKGKKGDG